MNEANIDLLESILTKTAGTIEAVKPNQLEHATPCRDFNVEKLIQHLVSWLDKFASENTQPGTSVDASKYEFDEDYTADFRRNARLLIEALRQQPSQTPMMGIYLVEYIVHGWDLATATGQTTSFSDAELKAALVAAKQMMKPEFRGEGKSFAVEVTPPEGASLTEQLVAFMGRQSGWKPGQ